MSYAAGELDRRLANIVRLGTIAQLDEAAALVTVKLDDELTTDWLPWVTARAGNTRTWSAPRVGEQVVVMSPSGEIAQGVVLPAIYQDAHPAPATSKDKEATVYPDGSTVEYDSAAHALTVTAGAGSVIVNCAHATINASADATINSPTTRITGMLQVDGAATFGAGATFAGSVTNNGVNIGSTHAHGGVVPGGGTTGAPV